MLDTSTNGGAPSRSLVLVAGSGRSGTSLLTGILQRLGYTVPQPEVPADDTNPRGFAESQWVVDFHARLLKRLRVQAGDARPSAWSLTASVGLEPPVADELRTWLAEQFSISGHVIVKDPRISWFLPLWRACAEDVGVQPRFVTMLRHPAAVVDSKQRWYGGWQGEIGRAAGWVNQSLFTERATREAPRILIRYEDLLEDWTVAIGRAGTALDLDVVRTASPANMRKVYDFVDRGLSRSQPEWGEESAIPQRLRELCDDVWEHMSRLCDDGGEDNTEVLEHLDELRASYAGFYAEAEAIAQSSIAAARRSHQGAAAAAVARAKPPAAAVWLIRRIPEQHRKRVPPAIRARVIRTLGRATAVARG